MMDGKEEKDNSAPSGAGGQEVQEADLTDSFKSVQMLILKMQEKFQAMSEEIVNRIDEMGHRINDLEQNISEMMEQADIEKIDNEISSTTENQNNAIGQSGSNKEQHAKKEQSNNEDNNN